MSNKMIVKAHHTYMQFVSLRVIVVYQRDWIQQLLHFDLIQNSATNQLQRSSREFLGRDFLSRWRERERERERMREEEKEGV